MTATVDYGPYPTPYAATSVTPDTGQPDTSLAGAARAKAKEAIQPYLNAMNNLVNSRQPLTSVAIENALVEANMRVRGKL